MTRAASSVVEVRTACQPSEIAVRRPLCVAGSVLGSRDGADPGWASSAAPIRKVAMSPITRPRRAESG
jgi:hypothetical protein